MARMECDVMVRDIYSELKEEINKKFGICWKAIRKKQWKYGSNCKRRSVTSGRWNK